MASGICTRCHRELKDPVSIEAEQGPICRAKGFGNLSLFDRGKPVCNFAVVTEDDNIIKIKDLGPWDQYMTITNGAEWVVEQLASRLNGRRLLYIDSEGDTDELLVKDGRFAGFKFVDNAKEAA